MSLFPDGLKTEKYKNGRGKSSGEGRGQLLILLRFQVVGKRKNFKPQTKAIFYLKFISLQHIKRWGPSSNGC